MKPRVIHSDPDIQGGVAVFVGTRVPVKNLFDYLEAGDSLDDFLKSFPSVTREQAVAALELAREALAPDVDGGLRDTRGDHAGRGVRDGLNQDPLNQL